MSQVNIARARKWYLSGMALSLRNNQSIFVLGENAGNNGFQFNETGVATRLTAIGEATGVTGTGTVTFSVYTDGIAAGNLVYQIVFNINAIGNFANTDTTADGSGPGASYGTGTDWFIKVVSAGFGALSFNYNVVLEGVHNG